MLDVMGTIFVTATIAALIAGIANATRMRLAGRVALASVAGGFSGIAAALAGAGALTNPVILGALFTAALGGAACAAVCSPAIRQGMAALPMELLVGLNVFRLGGVFFLLLAVAGRLAGPFPYAAGLGDILTGLFALALLALLRSGAGSFERRIAAWNAFGTLDLVVAVGLGVASANGSPLQLIDAGSGSAAITTLPWALIPTVVVPFFLILHAIVFAKLRSSRKVRDGAAAALLCRS